ncbi:IncN plasmid killer protein (plasmid) [Pseudomonas syringae]|uniref:IncN plasmid killer protein n=1 Tax=Pseudomonas syringae TaxID=317 RepID=A0A2K4X329_PSESX|nr:IncN plasmid killer protein [Pseudomonas syringae]
MNTFRKTADPQDQAAGKAVSGRGKTRVCALLAVCLLGSGSAFAGDPCKSVLCLYGKFTGNSGGSECRSAEQDYFSILVKKHGNIRWSQTATARQDYLNSCPVLIRVTPKKSTTSSARSGVDSALYERGDYHDF